MPGVRISNVHKRSHRAVVSDDEEGSSSDTSSKRARVNRDASVQSGNYEEESAEDVHQPGSIVRVKLTNFVTYTAAEFHPGPSLNMVIGPNGTGKSTLVCAICLGLGWSPKHLGRAKELGEFVKHGSETAEIEIELAAGQNHRRNPVIRRFIKKAGNKSMFFINGKQTTQQHVVDLARSFSIQIDNLCQFLPQDRVVEFAKLDPVSLLRETQRAAAPEQMIIWHDELKGLRTNEKQFELQQTHQETHLADLQKKQNATREDVERWNKRQELVSKAKALENVRPIIESAVLKNQLAVVKKDLDESKIQLRQLQAEEAPARQAQEDMSTYRDEIDQIEQNRKNNVDRAKKNVEKAAESIKTIQSSVKELLAEKEAEVAAEKGRKQDVKRFELEIAGLERQRSNEPVRPDEAKKARYAELRSEFSRIERRQLEVDEEVKAARRQAAELKDGISRKKGERAALNTQSGQQASLLARLSRDAANGWKWIENNMDQLQLKGKIHGPPLLNCTVTNPRMADAIEAQLRPMDLTAITCEDGEDAKRISNKLFTDLKLHNISIRTSPQPLSFYQSPVTREELTNYGLEGWLLDYVQGPEPVLAMLCDSAQIHRAAFSSRELSVQHHEALEGSPISVWMAGQRYQITRRREYNASSTRVTPIKKAQYFTDQPVNREEERRLADAIKELEQDLEHLKEGFQGHNNEKRQLKDELDQVKTEMKEIHEDQEARRKAFDAWRALPRKIAEKKTELENVARLMTTTSRRLRDLVARADNGALEIARKTLEYTKAVVFLRQLHESLVEAEIRLVEATSEVESLEHENRHIIQRVAAMKETIKQFQGQKKEIIERYNHLIQKANTALRNASDEERAIADQYRHLQSVVDLDNEIEAVNARLTMMADGNPRAVRDYEKREDQIRTTQEKLDEIRRDLGATRERIVEIREQWEPKLDALIARISEGFSHNFEGIGCAGQVGVYKDEDFENWSIQIQVRFRENESLSILDSHRQSGGERAVSTIFYLMALQDLARSPFRVVDEINQGMDPRNERMVHERMVDIACRERTSQYFLITPKLLSNLKYHPKMRIHCIASGEHMPDTDQEELKLNFQVMADRALEIRARSAITI